MKKKKKVIKRNLIVEQYSQSWRYIKECRNFIYAVIFIFIFASVLGFVIPLPESISQQIMDFLKELISKTEGLNQPQMILFIFNNNIQSGFMGMIFGIGLGIFPVLATLANGFILGYVANLAVGAEGFSSLLRLLPHGIFEIPALFISFGLGIKFGTFVFNKNKMKSFKYFLINSLRVFFFVVLPLLIIAAIIEGALICYAGACG